MQVCTVRALLLFPELKALRKAFLADELLLVHGKVHRCSCLL